MANVKWSLDPTHSEINFKVRHLMISTVTGSFKIFDGQAETVGDDFREIRSIRFKADVNSIDTNNEQRDTHLKSSDFFAAEENPNIVFEAESYNTTHEKINGTLTIRGTKKPIALDVEFGGVVVDPYGQTKAGLTVSGKISRKEYGLTWNQVTEAGSVVVSDEVKITAEVQFVKQA